MGTALGPGSCSEHGGSITTDPSLVISGKNSIHTNSAEGDFGALANIDIPVEAQTEIGA